MTIVTPFGLSEPSASAKISRSCPLTTKNVERHAVDLQRLRVVAAAPEHERIAALQPHEAAAASRRTNHHGVDFLLRQGVAPGSLADEEPLGAASQREHPLVHQRVVQHKIRAPQPRQRFASQERRVTGSGADERNVSDRGHQSLSRSTAEPAAIAETRFVSVCIAVSGAG